ncbi:MAG: threonylcarbamoyl-AMP synthase [Bifidobacteriaceae bacterium]|jgi:tRNA threonylcarbamoyl adenosine modification protein (Sua5/YciO/YrdC/YwlC family)|nr:threonylcarbamoyl-AMP synthase [Bifidobacteriaceae bacterium]
MFATPRATRAAGDVALAADAIARGELVVMPTDTVYGLAVDPRQPEAVARLFAVKRRPAGLVLPVLVANLEQLEQVAADLSPQAQALIEAFWPGPLTLVVRTNPAADLHLSPESQAPAATVAVRQPAHPVALELLEATGPLAVTSANLSAQPPATTIAEARLQLDAQPGLPQVAVYLEAGPASEPLSPLGGDDAARPARDSLSNCSPGHAAGLDSAGVGGAASTIVDVSGGGAKVLRQGPVSAAAIAAVLEGSGR